MLQFLTPQTAITQGKQLLDLFLNRRCPLCQRPTATILCPSCDRQIGQCRADRPFPPGPAGLPVVSWGRYEGSLRQAIGQLKYDGHTGIAQVLGTELGQTWRRYHQAQPPSSRPLAVIPIPLHPSKLQQRGFNQAELIAQGVCRLARLPLHSQVLLRVQATEAQHSLSRTARQHNLAQAFAVDPTQAARLRQTTVWLVDDIFTTGATAQAAAHTLRRSGLQVAGIATAARAVAWQQAPHSPAPLTR